MIEHRSLRCILQHHLGSVPCLETHGLPAELCSPAPQDASRTLWHAETLLALLRSPSYWLYGYAEGANMGSSDRAEARFRRYSLEERSKFERETLFNAGGRTLRSVLRPFAGRR